MAVGDPRVSIVVPARDEARNIERLIEALDRAKVELEAAGYPTETLIVDDGSQDDTWLHLRAAAASRPWLWAIRLRRGFGQTAALAAGFEHARGELIVPLDADLQNDPADVLLLLRRLEEGYDVVSGWRRHRRDRSLTRRLPSRVANWLLAVFSGLPLHDFGCTLKAYRRQVLEAVRLYGEMHRFIPIYAKWAGARIAEQEVQHHPRVAGRSKYGLDRTFKVLLDLATVKFLGDYSTKPIYLFGGAGALLCLGGIGCGALALIEKYAYGIWAHRNPLLLLAVMLFVVGMQLIGMGLIAELLVRTYHESQHKPTYLVAEEVNRPCAASPVSSLQPADASTSTRSAR
ncbi:MAG: glycosyltransferase family 2 protein [Deltaproteobacteria bacterium]|nr:glycosyltransferase family 2 protein [Deltaproteobacteria bacterium]